MWAELYSHYGVTLSGLTRGRGDSMMPSPAQSTTWKPRSPWYILEPSCDCSSCRECVLSGGKSQQVP